MLDAVTISTDEHGDYGPWAAEMLQRLGTSKFRAKFVLSDKDRAYARAKGKARRLLTVMHTRCWPNVWGLPCHTRMASRPRGVVIRCSRLNMPRLHVAADALRNGITFRRAASSRTRRSIDWQR